MEIILEISKYEDGKVQVLIKDTGTGIPVDLQEDFDSFLTGTTDGTGLGLSISKKILRAHDGDLELVESGETGTTLNDFTTWLAEEERLNFKIIFTSIKFFTELFTIPEIVRERILIISCSFNIKNIGCNALLGSNTSKLYTESTSRNGL